MKLTVKMVKDSSIPGSVNLCPTDDRFIRDLNETLQYLLLHGSFWQTEVPARFCIYDDCLTMPRQVASLQAVFSCNQAHPIRNQWWTMLENFNPLTGRCADLKFIQHGTAPTFQDPCGAVILRTYVTDPSDAGKKVTYLGHDENGVWIRTEVDSVWQDGETVTLTTDFVDTVSKFTDITGVVKEETNELIRLFSHPYGSDTLTALGIYEHDETVPSYQRYRITGFRRLRSSSGSQCTTCEPGDSNCGRIVDTLVKREFIPVSKDNDILPIGNLVALKLAMQAMRANDTGDLATFDALMYGDRRNKRIGAIPLLNQELRNYTADEFSGNVQLTGNARLRRQFAGFI